MPDIEETKFITELTEILMQERAFFGLEFLWTAAEIVEAEA